MALELKGGAIYLHVPKTGGNWVTRVLRECGLVRRTIGDKHADLDRVLGCQYVRANVLWRRVGRQLGVLNRFRTEKPFIFCFVRHPLSWYESWFKYMTQPARNWRTWGEESDWEKYWHPNAMLNATGDDDFNNFVRNVNAKRPGYVTEMFGWYTKPAVDFVGKQENLCEDLIAVLNTLHLEFDESFVRNYPRLGASPSPPRKVVWDDEVRRQTIKLEYAGIVRYGYKVRCAHARSPTPERR